MNNHIEQITIYDEQTKKKLIWLRTLLKEKAPLVYKRYAAYKIIKARYES